MKKPEDIARYVTMNTKNDTQLDRESYELRERVKELKAGNEMLRRENNDLKRSLDLSILLRKDYVVIIKNYKKALQDMLFAYRNADLEFPHQFETDAVNEAVKLLNQIQDGSKKEHTEKEVSDG